jgi:hypothetical protein
MDSSEDAVSTDFAPAEDPVEHAAGAPNEEDTLIQMILSMQISLKH